MLVGVADDWANPSEEESLKPSHVVAVVKFG